MLQQDFHRQHSPFSSKQHSFYGQIIRKVRIFPHAAWDICFDVWNGESQVQCQINTRRLDQNHANRLWVLDQGYWVAGSGRTDRRGIVAVERLKIATARGLIMKPSEMPLAFDDPYF